MLHVSLVMIGLVDSGVLLCAGCKAAPASYLVTVTYRKRGIVVRQGTCQRCVSRLSAYSNTVTSRGVRCYKPVKNAAGTGCGAQPCPLSIDDDHAFAYNATAVSTCREGLTLSRVSVSAVVSNRSCLAAAVGVGRLMCKLQRCLSRLKIATAPNDLACAVTAFHSLPAT